MASCFEDFEYPLKKKGYTCESAAFVLSGTLCGTEIKNHRKLLISLCVWRRLCPLNLGSKQLREFKKPK